GRHGVDKVALGHVSSWVVCPGTCEAATPYHRGRTATIALPEPVSGCLRGGREAERFDGEEGGVRHAFRGDRLGAPLLTVNHRNCSTNVEIFLPQSGNGGQQRAARGDHVLDHADGRPRRPDALKTVARAVLLCIFP